TGEDTVEISCHGSVVGTSLVLGAVLDAGARHALPGEFTKRAFISGKLDLTQAEAVADLLDAENADQLRLFSAQLEGGLGKKIKACSDKITEMLAAVYAYIDYPDEDMSDMSDSELEAAICEVRAELEKLCFSYASGTAVTKGVSTAIVGAPNTGKSTFFNLLAGFDRAIVTDIAGTTRDVITESVSVAGVKLLVSDTAGIRDTDDTVEKIGVERSKSALDECGLCIAVFDGSREMSGDDLSFAEEIAGLCNGKNVVAVINKTDIASDERICKMKKVLSHKGIRNIVAMSAKTSDGKSAFEDIIRSFYPEAESGIASGLIITNARQYAAVSRALEGLDRALGAIKNLTRDMAGLDLEEALQALCEADGREVSEQIVSTIFSRFCVGK
ncbi:MAG: tRNA uridine-5-carboxymethylaminomethyl(34) synthesis GTPase MnmE, partial [Clostridia bacterium]|nr:tRNA uridine-5-carboxymethylaminomethyl(34) synthesis GTPase MnmE [Clostridia bacterium]